MRSVVSDEITLELARLEREAIEKVRKRMRALQLGEAWRDLPTREEEDDKAVVSLVRR
jgi:hypothetical protein